MINLRRYSLLGRGLTGKCVDVQLMAQGTSIMSNESSSKNNFLSSLSLNSGHSFSLAHIIQSRMIRNPIVQSPLQALKRPLSTLTSAVVMACTLTLLSSGLSHTPVVSDWIGLHAHASTDRIGLASGQSNKAKRALMLAITQAGDALIAAGDRGYILRSTNQGQSWQQIPTPVSVALTDLFFVDDQYGWAVGHSGVILQTQDGGQSWQLQTDGKRTNHHVVRYYQQSVDKLEEQINQLSGDTLEEAEIALEELQFKLEDAEVALEDGPSNPLLSVWFNNRQQGWAVGAYGMILSTQDGGANWQVHNLKVPNPDGFHYNKIAALDSQTLLMAGEAGTLYRSDDQGENWQALDSPYEGSFFGFQTLPDNHLVAYGLRGNAFISSDRGDSWSQLTLPGRESVMASLVHNQQLILLSGSGSLWHTPISNLAKPANQFAKYPLSRALPISAAYSSGQDQLTLVGFGGIRTLAFEPQSVQSNKSAQNSKATTEENQ